MPAIAGGDLPHVYSGDDMRSLMLGESTPALKRKVGWAARTATRLGALTGLTANLEFVRGATQWWLPFGRDIAIIGGELVGLELAEFLTERGRSVNVIDDIPRFGGGLTIVRRMRLLAELKEHGVGLHAEAKDIRIERGAVHFTDSKGTSQRVSAAQVIVAKGAQGDIALAQQLRAQGVPIFTVGDCNGVGYIEGAMRGAAKAADDIAQAFG
jgi:hypothetical protein